MSRLDEPIPYYITDKGWTFAEGAKRVCATCGVDQLPSGYVYGDELYCNEHRPEHFTRDFREQQRRWDEEGLRPDFDCYWTTFETVQEIDGRLVLLCAT